MKLGQQVWKRKARRKEAQGAGRTRLAAHRAFAPLLGLWGALLGGLVILVLPSDLVSNSLSGTLLGTWGLSAQLLLAASTALLLGGTLLGLGLHWHGRARQPSQAPSLARAAVREVTPINPARDLGTRSLDDPLETMPFSTPAWRDADLVPPRAEPAPSAPATPAPASAPTSEPLELDLAAFAQLPGRNAVWVEDSAASQPAPRSMPEPAPVATHDVAPAGAADAAHRPAGAPQLRAVTPPPAAAPVPPVPGKAALTRLRNAPLGELSLAEMIERFAGALHEHRSAPPAAGRDSAEMAAREAALAEALRALAALSDAVSAPAPNLPQEEPLRAALAQLQPRRGAA